MVRSLNISKIIPSPKTLMQFSKIDIKKLNEIAQKSLHNMPVHPMISSRLHPRFRMLEILRCKRYDPNFSHATFCGHQPLFLTVLLAWESAVVSTHPRRTRDLSAAAIRNSVLALTSLQQMARPSLHQTGMVPPAQPLASERGGETATQWEAIAPVVVLPIKWLPLNLYDSTAAVGMEYGRSVRAGTMAVCKGLFTADLLGDLGPAAGLRITTRGHSMCLIILTRPTS